MTDTILIGGKNLQCSLNQVEIFSDGIWRLHKSNQSPCGKYQNYRLYQDWAAAAKKLFLICRDIKTGEILQHNDAMIMQEYYPGLQEWVTDFLNGHRRPVPLAYQRVDERSDKCPDIINQDVIKKIPTRSILEKIDQCWQSGKPLSSYPQTRKQGRYAAAVIKQQFDVTEKVAERLIDEWLNDGVISYEVSDKHSKLQGLKVTGICQPSDLH
jgi:hypothetical protein